MRRRPARAAAILVTALLALVGPWGATSLGQAPPQDLWEAFPLEPETTTPVTPEAPPATPETPASAPPVATPGPPIADDAFPMWAVIAGALAVTMLAGAASILALSRIRARRQAPDGAASAPAPTPASAAAAPAHAAPAPARPAPPPAARRHAPQARAQTPAPAVPPTPARRARADSGEVDDLELAELAAEYLLTVATGTRRPVVDLAARRLIPVPRAREMLGRARSRRILAGAGRGRPGGALTEKGRRLLEEGSRGRAGGSSAPPSPPGGPHLRLAQGSAAGCGARRSPGQAP